MTKEEYVTTFYINGKQVDVGMDDYGQSYFLEWEENGEKQEVGLGAYVTEYVGAAFFYLDPVYRHLQYRMYTDDLTDSELELYLAYCTMISEIYEDLA